MQNSMLRDVVGWDLQNGESMLVRERNPDTVPDALQISNARSQALEVWLF